MPRHIISVLTSPARPDLDEHRANAIRGLFGGGDLNWLARGIAVEFHCGALPDDAAAIADDTRLAGYDLVIQPAEGRRKAILLADMDSTMIGQECIDELADFAGIGPRVAEITARAMNGELDFHEALIERVGLLAGLPLSVIDRALAERITLAPGGRELVATMQANGGYCALVSGGFTAFTGPVAKALGFHEHRANTLLDEGGVLTGHVALPVLGRQAKIDALREIAAARGLGPADVLAVGDGANDLGMLSLAGTGVALHAKPVVAEQAAVRIDHADLTALLYLQGYHRDEFTTELG
ncbi:MAG: phosphoserine phosphatase SerB [Paracoccus sp. (in: a-proteobacteria)]|nr:phosphoserine phosphatase SerB [Paracoccus sp. (in: a-proteobacteria)]